MDEAIEFASPQRERAADEGLTGDGARGPPFAPEDDQFEAGAGLFREPGEQKGFVKPERDTALTRPQPHRASIVLTVHAILGFRAAGCSVAGTALPRLHGPTIAKRKSRRLRTG